MFAGAGNDRLAESILIGESKQDADGDPWKQFRNHCVAGVLKRIKRFLERSVGMSQRLWLRDAFTTRLKT